MAVKIRLKRLGKIRAPYYRIVVADSRTKRDGRVIEEIGKYHPTEEPSLIEVKSDRAQYWLGVGAQPTEQVLAILKITGDWQTFKGLPGTEGTLRTKAVPETAADAIKAAADAAEKAKAKAAEKVAAKKAAAQAAEAPDRGVRGSGRGPRRGDRGLMLADALEHLVRGIVDHPDEVHVAARSGRRGDVLEVRVHPDDLGRVIGRSGRTARALRTVVGALGPGSVRVDVVDVDRR